LDLVVKEAFITVQDFKVTHTSNLEFRETRCIIKKIHYKSRSPYIPELRYRFGYYKNNFCQVFVNWPRGFKAAKWQKNMA